MYEIRYICIVKYRLTCYHNDFDMIFIEVVVIYYVSRYQELCAIPYQPR